MPAGGPGGAQGTRERRGSERGAAPRARRRPADWGESAAAESCSRGCASETNERAAREVAAPGDLRASGRAWLSLRSRPQSRSPLFLTLPLQVRCSSATAPGKLAKRTPRRPQRVRNKVKSRPICTLMLGAGWLSLQTLRGRRVPPEEPLRSHSGAPLLRRRGPRAPSPRASSAAGSGGASGLRGLRGSAAPGLARRAAVPSGDGALELQY